MADGPVRRALVFTDIEGSTKLLQRLGEAYEGVLEAHHTILRTAMAAHGGREQSNAGDGFLFTFDAPASAVSGCLDAQLALARAEWPSPVRVRMGVHVGELTIGSDGLLVGLTVHEAARLAGAAHGGQVVASAAVVADSSELDGATWRDLGEHHLKDLDHPIRLHQLCHQGLEPDFPPLRSLDRPTGVLPQFPTALVGRDADLSTVEALLERARVVSVVGPGGAGKTRVAAAVAERCADGMRDGSWFVSLGPLSEDGLIWSAVAEALRVRVPPGVAEETAVIDALEERHLLLVLDNAEHVVRGAAAVASELTTRTADVRVLVTSRRPLDLPGEAVWRIRGLATSTVAGVASAAAMLFAEHASRVAPDVAVDARRDDIEALAAELGGHPLSLELVAAQLASATLDEVMTLARGRGLLDASAGRGGDAHASLRRVLDQSHDLLTPNAQMAFRRLAVMAGTFEVDDAAGVVGDDVEVPAALSELCAQSLLERADAGGRSVYTMHDAVRQYAGDRLQQAGEAGDTRTRHLRWFARKCGIDPRRRFAARPDDWFTPDERAVARRVTRRRLVLESGGLVVGLACAGWIATVTQFGPVGRALLLMVPVCAYVAGQMWRARTSLDHIAHIAGYLGWATGLAFRHFGALPLAMALTVLVADDTAMILWLSLVALPGLAGGPPRGLTGPRLPVPPAIRSLLDEVEAARGATVGSVDVVQATMEVGHLVSRVSIAEDDPARYSVHVAALDYAPNQLRWLALHAQYHRIRLTPFTTAGRLSAIGVSVWLSHRGVVADVVPVAAILANLGLVLRMRARDRVEEREADLHALSLTRDPGGLVEVLRAQALAGPSLIDPPWMQRVFDPMPPVAERMAMVTAWERAQRGA